MNEWSSVITAALPLLGVVIGVMLQYFFSRTAESKKQLELLRSQSYVDYLRSVARAAHAGTQDAQQTALADAADAKARIAVYGSQNVVAELARFEEAGPVLDNENSINCFLTLTASMRPSGNEVKKDVLKLVLIGKELRPIKPSRDIRLPHRS